MKLIALLLVGIAVSLASSEVAAVICVAPPVSVAFETSSSVVAASVETVSLRRSGAHNEVRQTILWRVHESWKGPHYKHSTFTTRSPFQTPLAKGQSMLLYLSGSEPHFLSSECSRSGLLEDSLLDIPKLYELQQRKLRPNNSFKGKPLRGSP
jgi:hypothetical protein